MQEKKTVRIQKFISECGEASRRGAEELIRAGRVRVNGTAASVGMSILPGRDRVTLDGRELHRPRRKLYIALNKPRGYITTLSDELGRKNVTELLDGLKERVYPVGRLDRDSEGLLLLTNDGLFANALTHPRYHVPKVYRLSVRPGITAGQMARMENGIELDGRLTAPAKVALLRQEEGRAVLEVTLFEGRNRQLRRMCEALGLEAARLSRVAFGSVKLGGLRPGQWRELAPREVASLLRAAGAIAGKGAPND